MPGYKGIPSSDPEEQRLREAWYAAEGDERAKVGQVLSDYLWNRLMAEIEEDRRRHPKKKRNLPKPDNLEPNPHGRCFL
jgi:hypothetical protein